MIRVKSLIQQANPVPDPASDPAQHTTPATPGAPARWRARRAGLALGGLAALAAAVVAVPAVFGPGGEGSGGDPAPPPAADEPYYTTTADLERSADLIVRARLDATRETEEDGIQETVATVSVAATARGETPDRTLQVSYPAPGSGQPDGPGLTVSHEYVLLLDRTDDGGYTLVNTDQGYYGIDAGHAEAGPDNDVALSGGVLAALGLKR
ncbi:hypothetical protein [Streptomyces sparsogenes]|uniref:Uncharacterized protein n=1 Tax=Streptomyces sparsogenes DSM 40356 TaxID=1331668 RepID=A0A1R1SQI9_9ACTN|nr:hypothetical protein [Streptomyces sparsogenes]OMI40299.1 hypothetical protein SPAR_06975 [Streptomyces sparsogenes DSM 40356]